MVAAVRGRASNAQKPRPRAPAKSAPRQAPRATARTNKFRGSADGAGLPPRIALIAASGVIVLCAGIILFTGNRLTLAGEGIGMAWARTLGGFGYKVESLQVRGASPDAGAAIAAAAGVNKDDPILAIDLNAVRENVQRVGWVESASVMRLLPNTIAIQVVAREPVAVWQMDGRMRVIDAAGQVIREADASRFPNLPLIIGAGANQADGAIFDLVKARPRLVERLEALVRVDGRRWDLRLKDGSIIQLPAVDEEAAMISLDQLDQSDGLLDLGFERVDLRSADMVVVRRREATPAPALPSTLPLGA